MTTKQTARLLGYMGLIPFVGLAVLSLMGRDVLSRDPIELLLGYAVVITSFMGGVIWGRRVLDGDDGSFALLMSIAGALIAYLGLIVGGSAGLEICALTLLGLFVYDWRSSMASWFKTLRLHLTLGAIGSCLLPIVSGTVS